MILKMFMTEDEVASGVAKEEEAQTQNQATLLFIK